MAVAPIPVFGLFGLFGLGEFVFWAVIFGEEAVPSLILVVVPVVVVLVDGDVCRWSLRRSLRWCRRGGTGYDSCGNG